MSDLISRQQAINAVIDELDMIDHVPQWVFKKLEGRLKILPSAQPEIIRCIDCVHYTPLGIGGAWGRCTVHSSPTEKQRTCQSCDFCSWAERRTDV